MDNVPSAAKWAFLTGMLLLCSAVAIDSAVVAWLLGPCALALFAFAMARSPLRYSLMAMMLCALTLENPNDSPAAGTYQSPLFSLGALMLAHMNIRTGQSWMFFSGMDLLIVTAGLIALLRNATNSKIDSRGRVRGPRIMTRLAYVSFAGSALVLAWGMLRGGIFQKALWQLDKVVYLPLIFLISESAIRGSKDAVALGRVVVTAACYKAAMAIHVIHFAERNPPDVIPDFAVSHHDSVLFAMGVTILISVIIHRARRRGVLTALLLGPLLVLGMLANDRRMVWVQIGLVFLTLYFTLPMNPVKRAIRKWVIRTSPLTVLYLVVGWFIPRGPFKPIATLRSVISPAQDVSTLLRDIENYNITQTLRANPVLGTGFGVGYTMHIPLPPMPHPLEEWLPHNSLLGLWFSAGFMGYTAMTLLWTTGVFFAVRAYRVGTRRLDRAAALVCFGSVLMYLIQCYGDVGIGSWIAVFTVGPCLALGGKLAVETGAWYEGKAQPVAPS